MLRNIEYELYEREGRALTTSRQVAEVFNKRHDNVLRDIEALECSADFNLLNFEAITYKDKQGRTYPEYLVTKDGFIFLVMGYTGKKAAAIKEAYIRRFNEMETFISSLLAARLDFPAFTLAVQNAHDEPKSYHYSNEINMIYRIVFGMEAKKLRQERGVAAGESIRPFLSTIEIQAVEELQRADIGMLCVLSNYADRKDALQKYYTRWLARKSLAA